jgi:hypothetical protein
LTAGLVPAREERVAQPVVLAVEDDGDVVGALGQALGKRYGADYQILTERARAGHTSVSFVLDRYGHLFPEADTALRARLDSLFRAATEHRRNTVA